ncbi:hypothetical protein [Pacificibacter sp. AS14]|uniref:hypothetical protein n=1 Tax=Pacificibacter sp. AS14 TaxID=3135785 RepID=UPI00316D26BE
MNGILVLVGLSLALFIPYHWWKLTHKFIGGFFVLSAVHFMLIIKPFALSDPIGLYVTAFCVLGMVSYVITLLPRPTQHTLMLWLIALRRLKMSVCIFRTLRVVIV